MYRHAIILPPERPKPPTDIQSNEFMRNVNKRRPLFAKFQNIYSQKYINTSTIKKVKTKNIFI